MMSNCYKRLLDVWGYNMSIDHLVDYQDFPSNYDGLFYYLATSGWSVTVDDKAIVTSSGRALSVDGAPWYYDSNYFNRSGNKIISPIVNRLLSDPLASNNGVLISAGRAYLATVILRAFTEKWYSLRTALYAMYNPIHNYDMTENTTINGTDNTELTHGKKTVNELTQNDNGSSKVYGFNSSSAVPASTATSDIDSTNTETNSGTDTTNNTTQQTTRLTRSGNIGVTTSQQMIESEVELRNKNNYYDIIFRDIDSILTIPIY